MSRALGLNHIVDQLPVKLQNFINLMKQTAASSGVKIITTVYGGLKVNGQIANGYFDDGKKELAFWIDRDNLAWIPIVAHEFSHMLQWRNKRRWWDSCTRYHTDLWEWMDGKNRSDKKLQRSLQANLFVEWDNEKQTVKLMQKYGLEEFINIEEYIKKANAYVLFYYVVRKQRKFYPRGQEPYNTKEVWEHMPATFDYDPMNPKQEWLDALYNYYLK